MRSTLSTVVALASSLQVASATYSWNNAPAFSCPANTNNHCNSQQSSGFDWSGLSFGSFSTYGSFDFSGFTCASSFGGGSKRDLLSGRGFQSTCITGTTHSDASSCPSFGCGSSSEVSAFSVSEIEISVEFDCSLEFHYSMPGGTTCKQTSSCSAGGSVVKNSQCGGATSVTVVYPSQTSGSGKTKTSCSIGVHSIGFDCSSASSTQFHSTATSSPTKPTTSPAQTTSSTTPVHTSSSSPVQVSSSSSPAATTFSTYVVQTTSTSAQVTVSSPGATTSSTLIAGTTSSTLIGGTTSSTLNAATTSSTLIAATISSSAQEVVSSPTSASVVDVVTTVVVDTTTTLCPVTLTHTNGNGISLQVSTSTSTLFLTTTKTVCTRCEAQSTSSPIATSAPAGVQSSSAVYVPTTVITSSGPITTATCPDVLPQCLNTWLFIEGCSSNADTACFCPSSDFVSNVFSCLSAYGASDTEISSAQTYFQGICAPYIPSNPALVTCASSVTATVTQSYPVTTITVSQIITVPCTQTTGVSAGYTIASSFTTTVLSTQVTVPQVVFTTVGTTSGGAVLITGAPTIGNAGVAAPTVVPTYSTLAVTTTSNGTTKATSTPTQVFSGSAGKNNIAIGASLFAVLFAVLIL